jgi:hypothetical protein
VASIKCSYRCPESAYIDEEALRGLAALAETVRMLIEDVRFLLKFSIEG